MHSNVIIFVHLHTGDTDTSFLRLEKGWLTSHLVCSFIVSWVASGWWQAIFRGLSPLIVCWCRPSKLEKSATFSTHSFFNGNTREYHLYAQIPVAMNSSSRGIHARSRYDFTSLKLDNLPACYRRSLSQGFSEWCRPPNVGLTSHLIGRI